MLNLAGWPTKIAFIWWQCLLTRLFKDVTFLHHIAVIQAIEWEVALPRIYSIVWCCGVVGHEDLHKSRRCSWWMPVVELVFDLHHLFLLLVLLVLFDKRLLCPCHVLLLFRITHIALIVAWTFLLECPGAGGTWAVGLHRFYSNATNHHSGIR